MNEPLEAAAQNAGLIDMDMLKLVDTALAPKAAIASLRAKYPGAFAGYAPSPSHSGGDVRHLPEKDYRKAEQKLYRDTAQHERTTASQDWMERERQKQAKYEARGRRR